MSKKVLSLILAMTLTLTMASCGSKSTDAPDAPDTPAPAAQTSQDETKDGVHLRLVTQAAHSKTTADGKDAFYENLRPYLEENNITLDIEYIANDNWQDYMTKLQTMIASGNTPDLLYVPAEGENMAYNMNITTSLKPYLDQHPDIVEDYEKNVPKSLRNATLHDGEPYGLVHLWECSALWLNTNRLKEAGLEVPDINWTWDEFEQYCEALSDPANNKYAISSPSSYYLYNQWLYSFGTGYLDDSYTEVTFDSDASVELLDWWAGAVEKGWASAYNPASGGTEAQDLMNGTIAMANTGRWSLATFADNDFTDLAVVYVPVKNSPRKSFAFASFQVCGASENFEAAAALACWTASADYVSKMGVVAGEIPSRYDCMTSEELPFEFQNQEIFFDMPDDALSMQNPSYFADLGNAWQSAYTAAIAGEKESAAACADAAQEMRSIVANNS